MNMELLTHSVEIHRQELQNEADHYRMIAKLPSHQYSVVRHTVAQLGIVFVRVGMKLKQVEMYREPQAI